MRKSVDDAARKGANGIDSLAELAAALRHLRRRQARQKGDAPLTYRELAATTGWAHGVIGDYFAGKTLPPTDRFDVLVRLLGASGVEQGALATARDRVEERRRGRGPVGGDRPVRPPVPRELPPDVPVLIGRERQLARLLSPRPSAPSGRAVIVALDGPAGVGTSALAVHAAHRLADRFPDGQLYADLRGPGGRPMPPAVVLARFLRALGGPAVPPGSAAEAGACYRALAAGRRLLVVLDNAHDAAQVRPLLPAAPGSVVLVASRRVLATVDGVEHVRVGTLPDPDALELLGAFGGTDRLSGERRAAEAIVRHCGGLPLALRVAGARLAARPGWPVRALADRLADARQRLDELACDDLRVRDAFRQAYDAALHGAAADDHAAASALPLLARHDGGGLTLRQAAGVLDLPEARAERVLERLVDARLLDSPAPREYRFHALLRLFALEQGVCEGRVGRGDGCGTGCGGGDDRAMADGAAGAVPRPAMPPAPPPLLHPPPTSRSGTTNGVPVRGWASTSTGWR
ncbi:NB-ARC domain-containing protein [Streptomyces sp. NPDC003077]|uniref:NB-ARC domain-containing protein n=1 Tax=Streptomyces sp. NPDC003077 TaxID=3154443 RepID=UPI00339F8365